MVEPVGPFERAYQSGPDRHLIEALEARIAQGLRCNVAQVLIFATRCRFQYLDQNGMALCEGSYTIAPSVRTRRRVVVRGAFLLRHAWRPHVLGAILDCFLS